MRKMPSAGFFWTTAVDWRDLRDFSSGCFPLGMLLLQQECFCSLEAGLDGHRVDLAGRGSWWLQLLLALTAVGAGGSSSFWQGFGKCSALLRLVWAASSRYTRKAAMLFPGMACCFPEDAPGEMIPPRLQKPPEMWCCRRFVYLFMGASQGCKT